MQNLPTLPVERAVASLMSQPTAEVAVAARNGAASVGSVELNDIVLRRLYDEVQDATGARAWSLEHLRDRRPLGEVLEVSRLILAQRRTLVAA